MWTGRGLIGTGRILTKCISRLSSVRRTVRNKTMSSTTDQSSVIVKSLNDKRDYRFLVLDNGLRALLISDGDEDEVAMETSDSEMSTHSDEEGSDLDDEMSGDDDDEGEGDAESNEKKSAAALCIGVGSFSDPDDIQGFAHFLEHMVFMGSEKFPKENDFDDYVSRHGGHTNAWTDHERTCFYFEVDRDYFHKSLDKFAQFFVSPLLLKDSMDREIEAVDSEFQERVRSDADRLSHIMAATAKPGNPMAKFLLGNLKSLKIIPGEKNIDVYGRLRDFFNRYYTAQYMTLAVHSKHSLDVMEAWTRESFTAVHNNKEAQLSFHHLKDPFDTPEFRKIYKVIPVKKTHKLYITWPFPPLQHMYRVKPLDYMESLLNHEGEGSVYSYLKKRNWAFKIVGGNSGCGCDMNTTWSGFDICVKMTDKGMEHVNDVIHVIFEYIHLMKKAGPQEWYYNEMQLTENNKFRWKEQGDPTDYVEKVADYMQLYPPEHYLTGNSLHFTYDPLILTDCMENLRADNCNIMLMSSNYTETQCNLKERWFGAHYCVEDICPKKLKYWSEASENSKLYLPKENQFISTDFSLKDVKDATQLPKQVSAPSHCKLFYKKDNKFNVPKGFVHYHLKSPVAFESLKSAALFDVFAAILYHHISEPTYSALLAGYTIVCSSDTTQTGLTISVSGFNHKLKDVLLVVFDLLVNFTVTEDMFEAMKAEKKKAYYNGIIKPSTAARMLRWTIMDRCYWSMLDRYQVIESLTRTDLLDLVHKFLHNLAIEALVMGNFTEQEAANLNEDILDKLPSQPNIDEAIFHDNVIELPREKRYCQIGSFNPEETISSVTNFYQSTPGNMRKLCLNGALVSHMTEPCFNTLRTKQQLGYSVGCTNYLTCGVVALGIFVECKANKFSMNEVDCQIELFMEEMKGILEDMTHEEFDTLIESEVTSKKIEDTHLGEEVERHWREILDETYVFDRHLKEIEILKTLTKEELLQWFTQEYFGDNQRKLSIQIVGNQGNTNGKLPSDADQSFKCLKDPEQNQSKPVEDIHKFKNCLKYLPYTKIIL